MLLHILDGAGYVPHTATLDPPFLSLTPLDDSSALTVDLSQLSLNQWSEGFDLTFPTGNSLRVKCPDSLYVETLSHHISRPTIPTPAPKPTHEAADAANAYRADMESIRRPPLSSRSPARPSTRVNTSMGNSNALNLSALSLLDGEESLRSSVDSVEVPIADLMSSARAAKQDKDDLGKLKETLNVLRSGHEREVRELEGERDKYSRIVGSLAAKVEEEKVRRQHVEVTVKDIVSADSERDKEVRDLQERVRQYERDAVSNKVGDVERVESAIAEATAGVEELLHRERAKHSREKRAWAAESEATVERALTELETRLRKEFAADKAMALANAQQEMSAEITAAKSAAEDRVKKKVSTLTSQHQARERQTAADVKALTALHRSHVSALEKALREETARLGKSREQVKQLTMSRAAETARFAAERESMAKDTAENLKTVTGLKEALTRLERAKGAAEARAVAAVSEAGKRGEERRMSRASLSGIKGRLAEAEAEVEGLRRQLEETIAESRGSGEVLELLRRENAVLRKSDKSRREELNRMKDALLAVNKSIYGAKAAEMCKTVALGGRLQEDPGTKKKLRAKNSPLRDSSNAYYGGAGGDHEWAADNKKGRPKNWRP